MKTNYINITSFKKKGSDFFDPKEKFDYENNLHRLERISNNIFGGEEIKSFEIEEILEEYWQLADGESDEFNEVYSNKLKRKTLLIVFNSLYDDKRISTSSNLNQLLSLFQDDDSELMVHKWVSALISGWEHIVKSKSNFDLLTSFIFNKFDSISSSFNRTKILKANTELFLDKKGPHTFAKRIINQKTSQERYSKEVAIVFSANGYHSMVCEELFQFYLKTKKFDSAALMVEEIAQKPENYLTRTKKKILSTFIINVDKQGLNVYKELAKETGFRNDIIGDPEVIPNWVAWEGASASEKDQLEKARVTLNKWILTSFVELFFRIIINDPARQKYWLKKIPIITSIRIYGSGDDKRRLKRDERISSYVDKSRFTTLISSNDDNAGIMMEIGDYQIIEFTGQGALYCYKTEEGRLPKTPYSVRDLKHTYMDMACQVAQFGNGNGYVNGKAHWLSDEGRIFHSGNWQGRTDLWLRNYAI